MTRTSEHCDLLVAAPWLLPMTSELPILRDTGLAIRKGRIVAVGPSADLRRQFKPVSELDLSHHVVLPGLINAHGHAPMTLLRGAGEDQSLQAWLHETIWPLEKKLMSPEFVRLGSDLAIAEMLKSGTTLFADMYFFPEIVAAAAKTAGMGCEIAFPVIEMPNAYSEHAQACFHKGLELHDHYRHDELVRIAIGPHAPYTVTRANLEKTGMYAAELDLSVQIHLHENAQEVADAHATNGMSNIALLGEIGLLGPQLQAVHMTEVDDADFELLCDTRTNVIHCPSSNMKLASGYCDIEKMLKGGITLGIGTDGAASNNHLDMFNEIHLAALMAKHESANPEAGHAATLLHMATAGGAAALGLGDELGCLEPGKRADFIAVDLRRVRMLPLYDPYAALVHGGAGHAVDHVFVNGEHLLDCGELVRLSETELVDRVQHWQQNHAQDLVF
jgi:5-methylthioadenosine/S-adenosylhomocysteine deaminase